MIVMIHSFLGLCFPVVYYFHVVELENTDIASWISSLLSRCFSKFSSQLYCTIA